MDKQGTFNAQLYNTNAEIAEAFIPFIEAYTPLRRNGAPLPVIIDAAFSYEAAFYLQSQEAAGIYQARFGFRKDADADAKARGRIIFNHDIGYDATRVASVFLHELVHWMQDINGTSQRVEHMADHGPLEFEAYAVQAAFLRKHGLDPYADFPEVFSVIESNYGKPGSPAPLFCLVKSLADIVRSYDFRVATREQFIAATDKPAGLDERATSLMHHTHVIYDPLDDSYGLMLWGDDPDALCREVIAHYEME